MWLLWLEDGISIFKTLWNMKVFKKSEHNNVQDKRVEKKSVEFKRVTKF